MTFLTATFFTEMVAAGRLLTTGAIDDGLGFTVAGGTVACGICPIVGYTNVAAGMAVPGTTVPGLPGTAVAGTTVPGLPGTAVAGAGPRAVVGTATGPVTTGALVVGMKTVDVGSNKPGIVMTG